MGAFYNSICVPGHRTETVRQILVRWLAAKGYEVREGPMLFDLDGERERSVYLVSNDRWTVLFYSHYEEERRLVHELQGELAPILYVWVYDGEVWGYDLFDERGFAGSFNSDPRVHESFAEHAVGAPARPRGAAESLCRLLEVPVEPAELHRIERLRSPFKEEICRELCRALGVEVAASSYDDLESGALQSVDDWRVEQLLFARRDQKTGSQEIDLHLHGLKRLRTDAGYAFTETVSLPPEIVEELRQMRRRVRWKFRLLRPVSWLAGAWRRLRESSARGGSGSVPAPRDVAPASTFRVESAVLLNDRHRCRLTLAEGARPTVVSRKPSAVFAFETAGVTVTCTARRLSKIDEVLRKPSRAKVLDDENYRVGGRPARHLLFELPPSFVAGAQHPSYLALYVVRTPKALYVFLYRSPRPLAESVELAVRATVDSFRLLED